MLSIKKTFLTFIVSIAMLPVYAFGYAFEYTFGDPNLASSQTYIESTQNLEIRNETYSRYWKPITGASTYETTTPGVMTMHFDFASMGYTDPVSEISLGIFMPIFHWSYSQGHNILYGSKDGITWINLAEAAGVAYGGYANIGTIIGLENLLGTNDLWLKAELYSYGPSASSGGVSTNTAQFARYDVPNDSTTFRLGVNFAEDEQNGEIPVPAPLALMGLGLLGLGFFDKRKTA